MNTNRNPETKYQFLQASSEMMFENVALSAIAHSICVYDNKIDLCNTSTAINLDDHGDAGLDLTWISTMASIALTISWDNLPDAVKNRSVQKQKENVRFCLENRVSKCTNKKCQNCTHNLPFFHKEACL